MSKQLMVLVAIVLTMSVPKSSIANGFYNHNNAQTHVRVGRPTVHIYKCGTMTCRGKIITKVPVHHRKLNINRTYNDFRNMRSMSHQGGGVGSVIISAPAYMFGLGRAAIERKQNQSGHTRFDDCVKFPDGRFYGKISGLQCM